MIQLPPNYMKLVQIKEFPHKLNTAVFYLRFKNDHDQYLGFYQTVMGQHGLEPKDMIDDGLAALQKVVLEFKGDPFIDDTHHDTAPAEDQHWQFVKLPDTVTLKEFKIAHNMPVDYTEDDNDL